MLYTSGTDQKQSIAQSVFDYYTMQNDLSDVDVEVFHTDLSEDCVYGWCEQSDENEFQISIHNDLSLEDYCITLFHELVHVTQTICGLFDEEKREEEASTMEKVLYQNYCASLISAH